MKKIIIIISVLILVLILGYLVYRSFNKEQINNSQEIINISPTDTISPEDTLALPIAEFAQRVTKKPFGIYVDPENSPVQPERFQGYHTGVDVEYEDIDTDVPVYAVSDGKIVLSKSVSGYGGVTILEIENNNILYGHLRPDSMLEVGKNVNKGDQIGLLGTGFSSETDDERKHLHYAILSDNRIDFKGYVQNQSDLSDWIDPLL